MGMTDKKILAILDRYDEKIKESIDQMLPPTCDEDQRFLDKMTHAGQMLPKMRSFLAENRREKVFRWLGFLQGIFYSFGLYTIDEMAGHNRPTKSEIKEVFPDHPFEAGTHDKCETCTDYANAPD